MRAPRETRCTTCGDLILVGGRVTDDGVGGFEGVDYCGPDSCIQKGED